MVEFALVLPVLLLVLIGVVQFALVHHAQNVVTTAAQEGARLAAAFQVNRQARHMPQAVQPNARRRPLRRRWGRRGDGDSFSHPAPPSTARATFQAA